jgi:hypothetical protein
VRRERYFELDPTRAVASSRLQERARAAGRHVVRRDGVRNVDAAGYWEARRYEHDPLHAELMRVLVERKPAVNDARVLEPSGW